MTLDDMKRSIGHDDECAARSGSVDSVRGILRDDHIAPECNCSRRRKIAAIDRDEELFTTAIEILDGKRSIADWREWEERVRARTEEDST